MKIIFISPNPVWGGAATANLAIAKLLQDDGNTVIYNDEYLEKVDYKGVKIDHTPIHRNKFKKATFRSFIKKEKPDVILWTQFISIYYIGELERLKRKGIKQMCILHSLSLEQNLNGKFTDLLVSLCLRKMDSVICVSDFTKKSWCEKSLLKGFENNFHVIHNTVNKAPKHVVRTKGFTVGFVGRFSDEKQPEVFCKLSESMSKYKFVAFGDGPLLETLRNKYKIVEFRGQCSETELIYKDIDILLLTSKFENCPMVVLEAESRGIPCVAPNVGGISEIVQSDKDGILFSDFNELSIIKGIDQVSNHYDIFSESALANSTRFSPEVILQKWRSLFNQS